MAKKYLGLNKGQTLKDIQTGSSDLGTDIQIVVDDTNSPVHYEVDEAVRHMLEAAAMDKSKVV